MITCFKGSWQLMEPKTRKIKAKKPNFPKENASVPQASGNIQEAHKTVEGGKEPNVKPDDKKINRNRETGTCVLLGSPNHTTRTVSLRAASRESGSSDQ